MGWRCLGGRKGEGTEVCFTTQGTVEGKQVFHSKNTYFNFKNS